MFSILGKFVSHAWPLLLVGWIVTLVGLKLVAPPWKEVAANGEFAFLPKTVPSRLGEDLFRKAWEEPFASNVVVIVRRESSEDGLLETDKQFIEDELRPRLEKIAAEEAANLHAQPLKQKQARKIADVNEADAESDKSITVRTFSDKSVGRLLNSVDNKASLVLMELPTEFLDARNMPLIKRVQNLIDVKGEMQTEGIVPRGLDMALSGSATVGRDMMQAAKESSRDTEKWTVILVVLLLIAIYRAPLMAIIPLITVGVATEISLALLALLAKAGYVNIFSGIEVYVKVLSYGAGVDYCLFLIARYKEELDEGATLDGAVANSLSKVGHALVASAGTVICGIFMMYFAEFGKFSQAGIAITLGLVVVLAASLTFSPALLRLARRWAFWPRIAGQNLPRTAGWVSATSLWSRVFDRNLVQLAWNHVSDLVRGRPGTVLLSCFLVMLPFACIGVHFHGFLSYGLLAELPRNTASVIGSEAVSLHFPPGIGGPMTVLIHDKQGSFLNEDEVGLSDQAKELVHHLTDSLRKNSERLQLSDVRSVLQPYGGTTAVADDESARQENTSEIVQAGGIKSFLNRAGQASKNRVTQDRTLKHYVSSVGDLKGKILRLDLVLQEDPFARNSIAQFESIRQSVQEAVPAGVEVFAIGPTASIRDLKNVTDRDQIRIDVLVLGGVFLILIVLLRRVMISLYLIISVFFSYLVTLGVTFTAFYLMNPGGFVGLDWKVPMFLFTILIAVGEDYNIFLMTRIDEEQAIHGPTAGVISALRKTGSIISSCGIIMAGTFCSLMAGSLAGLHQLGFALAFGVLLDTFVVRPILVPAFLVLLHEGRLGSWQRLIGRSDQKLAASVVNQPLDVGGE